MSNNSLEEQVVGFRLDRLEVYNWGTFNQHIWSIEPRGTTSLLTGANGSGKSTLVDALLTLLVPTQKRGYNQASGNDKRRERDEKTYVRGAYGKKSTEDSYIGESLYLRNKDAYSVLLAVFHNKPLNECVSIAQVFWFENDGMKKVYLTSQRELSIQSDLRIVGDIKYTKQQWKVNNIYIFDEFSKYIKQFQKYVGFRSIKALELFNQTASIKEIGGLNNFIRQHMLDKTDIQEHVNTLIRTYEDLTQAHNAIQKAESQLQLLKPLLADGDAYDQAMERRADQEKLQAYLPEYFAAWKITIFTQEINRLEPELDLFQAQRVTLEAQQRELQNQSERLYAAIQNNTVGQRIQTLEQQLEYLKDRFDTKMKRANKYNTITSQLSLPIYTDQQIFHQSIEKINNNKQLLKHEIEKLMIERDDINNTIFKIEESIKQIRLEISSLEQRKNQIPSKDAQIRDRMATDLNIDPVEIPFIGELIRVIEREQHWEGAIERLLNGFARQLLIPERHYQVINDYVNTTNLKGRLIYHRVPSVVPSTRYNLEPRTVPSKTEIKPDSEFYPWIKQELNERFNYVCCDSIEQFQRDSYALTATGLIKHGRSRHEKDDRQHIQDRRHYVLGWDNHSKIQALNADLQHEYGQLLTIKSDFQKIEQKIGQRNEWSRLIDEFLGFDDFADIDWKSVQQEINDRVNEKETLLASSDQLNELREQKYRIDLQREDIDRSLTQVGVVIQTTLNIINEYKKIKSNAQNILVNANSVILEEIISKINTVLDDRKTVITINNINEIPLEIERYYSSSIASINGYINTLETKINKQIIELKNAYPMDTKDIDASIKSLAEIRRMLQSIIQEDLPRHAERFKSMLNDTIITHITVFQNTLDQQRQDIEEKISQLNSSLQSINFTPSTYIKLNSERVRDTEIQEFQNNLRDCFPDIGDERTMENNEASFNRIKRLIDRFKDNDRWVIKVTDVRNWLNFSATEYYREDNSEKNYYSDSAGKSGGQKAKLAYTILASAIAYQFSVARNDFNQKYSKSFHFVVIDEAFSKSDEANAKYAMDLFKQLNLQLLVITPLDKTHVVEPYIGACHFVKNNQEENNSQVYNLTMQQYYDKRAFFVSEVSNDYSS